MTELKKKLLAHFGHDIVIATYGKKPYNDVCVECESCNMVIISTEDEDENI